MGKSKKIIAIIAVGVVVAIAICIIAFSNTSKIYGVWEVAEESADERLNGYPEDDFVIYEDDTFTCDGMRGTYFMDDDTITLTVSILGYSQSRTYEYDVSGDVLMLKYVADEDKPEIYYDRVN